MPGFREQAQELASDPQKWKEAMQSAKEQMLKLKEKRDQMKSKGESPKDTRFVNFIGQFLCFITSSCIV